jgi:glucose-6-phosphate 1-epimerase
MRFKPEPGPGGSPRVSLISADGARAEVHLHGAHVTSWRPAGEDEDRLYLSATSRYGEGEAIRGGIPVCFPQFSRQGPLPNHGLVRTTAWTLLEAGRDDDGTARARLRIVASAASRQLWPHPFAAELAVAVTGRTLVVQLSIRNPGDSAFTFTAALHSYLAVRDVRATTVRGLAGLRFRDKVAGADNVTESAASLAFAGPVDRVYYGAPDPIVVAEPGRTLQIRASGFPDTVVWNPWAEAGAALDDLASGDFARMLCVEAAAARAPVTLAPGATWTGSQRLEAV